MTEDSGETFVAKFTVPPQILLHPEWEAMAHDHALGMAHEQGIIPVGPIIIETEIKKLGGMVEGQPMQVHSLEELLGTVAQGLGMEVVEVTATMMVGSRL